MLGPSIAIEKNKRTRTILANFIPYLLFFFLKHPGALGNHIRILGTHVDRIQRRRDCPSSLGMRHTEVLTPHAHTHACLSIHGKIPRRVTLERGISGGLHIWSAHHPSYGLVPLFIILVVKLCSFWTVRCAGSGDVSFSCDISRVY